MVAYPGMTALDLIGPQYALSSIMGSRVSIVAKTREPVVTDTGVTIVPDLTFETCPRDLTVLFIPGGSQGSQRDDGLRNDRFCARSRQPRKMGDECVHGFAAAWLAGLLRGYAATSHWLVRDTVLPVLEAEPLNERVVVDRNRVTGAGVSAGLDFGLLLVSKIKDEEYARAVQLMEEYDPHPPFISGTPEKAGPKVAAMMSDMHRAYVARTRDIARGIANSWRS